MGLAHLRYVSFSYGTHLTHRDNGKMMRLVTSPRYRDLWGDRFAMLKVGEQKIENDQTGWKFATSRSAPSAVGGQSIWKPFPDAGQERSAGGGTYRSSERAHGTAPVDQTALLADETEITGRKPVALSRPPLWIEGRGGPPFPRRGEVVPG
jgi:hypothetical protein